MTTTLGFQPLDFMRSLKLGTSPVKAFYPSGSVVCQNLQDEIVDGSEGTLSSPQGEVSALVKSISRYNLRMLGTAPGGHVFLTPESLHSPALALAQYHRDNGLNDLPDEAILPIPEHVGRLSADAVFVAPLLRRNLDAMSNRPRALFPFIHSKYTQQLAERLALDVEASYSAVDQANHKGVGLRGLQQFGVSVPDGKWVHSESAARAEFARLASAMNFAEPGSQNIVFAKLVRAASGMGVKALTSHEAFEKFLSWELAKAQLNAEGFGLRFDAGVPATSFPNVMIYVGRSPSEDRFVSASDQILKKNSPEDSVATVHVGNKGPLSQDVMELMLDDITKIASWHRSIGAYGLLGIDFLYDAVNRRVVWLENNFRVNGNNHAAFMAIRLGVAHWAALNGVVVPTFADPVEALKESVRELKKQGIHYDPDSKEGVFVNNSAVPGKLQVGVTAKTPEQRDEFVDRLMKIFT